MEGGAYSCDLGCKSIKAWGMDLLSASLSNLGGGNTWPAKRERRIIGECSCGMIQCAERIVIKYLPLNLCLSLQKSPAVKGRPAVFSLYRLNTTRFLVVTWPPGHSHEVRPVPWGSLRCWWGQNWPAPSQSCWPVLDPPGQLQGGGEQAARGARSCQWLDGGLQGPGEHPPGARGKNKLRGWRLVVRAGGWEGVGPHPQEPYAKNHIKPWLPWP